MIRIPNWDLELTKWAGAQINQKVKWGVNDCSSLVRAGLNLIYDFNITEGVKWYRTVNGAIRTHIITGGAAALLKKHGAYEIAPLLATTGDVMIVSQRQGDIADNASMILGRQFLLSEPGMDAVELRHIDEMIEDYNILRLPNG